MMLHYLAFSRYLLKNQNIQTCPLMQNTSNCLQQYLVQNSTLTIRKTHEDFLDFYDKVTYYHVSPRDQRSYNLAHLIISDAKVGPIQTVNLNISVPVCS